MNLGRSFKIEGQLWYNITMRKSFRFRARSHLPIRPALSGCVDSALALGALPAQLDDGTTGREAGAVGQLAEMLREPDSEMLGDSTARVADNEHCGLGMVRVAAGNISVQRLDPVHAAIFLQPLQRAVDSGWCIHALRPKRLEDLIRRPRPAFATQEGQNPLVMGRTRIAGRHDIFPS